MNATIEAIKRLRDDLKEAATPCFTPDDNPEVERDCQLRFIKKAMGAIDRLDRILADHAEREAQKKKEPCQCFPCKVTRFQQRGIDPLGELEAYIEERGVNSTGEARALWEGVRRGLAMRDEQLRELAKSWRKFADIHLTLCANELEKLIEEKEE